jgi:hypothetical protein
MLIIMANSSNVHLCIEAAPSVSDAGASTDRTSLTARMKRSATIRLRTVDARTLPGLLEWIRDVSHHLLGRLVLSLPLI